jgi:hypothetical protein
MYRALRPTLLITALLAASAASVRAQNAAWEVGVHAGLLSNDLFEQRTAEALIGGRLMRRWNAAWSTGVTVDFVRAGETVVRHSLPKADVEITRGTLDVEYTIPAPGPALFFLRGGAGVVRVAIDDRLAVDLGEQSFLGAEETRAVVPIGLGIRVVDRPERPRIAFRMDIEDRVVHFPKRFRAFPAVPERSETESLWTNSWTITGGLSLFFGGGPPAAASPAVAPPRPAPPAPLAPAVEPPTVVTPPAPEPTPITPAPGPEPRPVACADQRPWFVSDAILPFHNQRWIRFGGSTIAPRDDLLRIGTWDQVPVYVRYDGPTPPDAILLPLCAPHTYQKYVPEPEVRGTTG